MKLLAIALLVGCVSAEESRRLHRVRGVTRNEVKEFGLAVPAIIEEFQLETDLRFLQATSSMSMNSESTQGTFTLPDSVNDTNPEPNTISSPDSSTDSNTSSDTAPNSSSDSAPNSSSDSAPNSSSDSVPQQLTAPTIINIPGGTSTGKSPSDNGEGKPVQDAGSETLVDFVTGEVSDKDTSTVMSDVPKELSISGVEGNENKYQKNIIKSEKTRKVNVGAIAGFSALCVASVAVAAALIHKRRQQRLEQAPPSHLDFC